MPQNIGINAPTRVPTFGDDASIEEALRKYHYGIDNWSQDPVQDNLGIDGNFKSVKDRLTAAEAAITDIVGDGGGFIRSESKTSNPNSIIPETENVVALTINAKTSGQTTSLQRWRNSSGNDIGRILPDGSFSVLRYINVGSISQVTTTALNIVIGNAAHKGIVVQAASSPTANIQEWVASNGTTILGRVDATGKMFSNNIEVVTLSQTQTLTNKTLTSPTISTPTISGGSMSNATSITLTGSQAVNSFRARNINVSTAGPSGGADGDVWLVYS
jgi:hypothetical protein